MSSDNLNAFPAFLGRDLSEKERGTHPYRVAGFRGRWLYRGPTTLPLFLSRDSVQERDVQPLSGRDTERQIKRLNTKQSSPSGLGMLHEATLAKKYC